MNGMNWLLISSDAGDEEVHAYSDSEMADLYTPAQRADLIAGKAVVTKAWAGRALLRAVDMLAAARRVTN